MIFIRLIAIAFRRELVARHARHNLEHALVANAAPAQLGGDHAQPQSREYGIVAGEVHSELGNLLLLQLEVHRLWESS
jgi:hypothetical protein